MESNRKRVALSHRRRRGEGTAAERSKAGVGGQLPEAETNLRGLPSHIVRFVIRVLVAAAALWAADYFIAGIKLSGDIWQILLIALVFGIVNAILKPILKLLSLPVLIITLGLFAIIINTALLAITAGLMENLTVDSFISALLGSLIISVVSAVLNAIIPDPD